MYQIDATMGPTYFAEALKTTMVVGRGFIILEPAHIKTSFTPAIFWDELVPRVLIPIEEIRLIQKLKDTPTWYGRSEKTAEDLADLQANETSPKVSETSEFKKKGLFSRFTK